MVENTKRAGSLDGGAAVGGITRMTIELPEEATLALGRTFDLELLLGLGGRRAHHRDLADGTVLAFSRQGAVRGGTELFSPVPAQEIEGLRVLPALYSTSFSPDGRWLVYPETDGVATAGLGSLLSRGRDGITMFKSLGLAVEDLAAARYVYERAQEAGLGVAVELGGLREPLG